MSILGLLVLQGVVKLVNHTTQVGLSAQAGFMCHPVFLFSVSFQVIVRFSGLLVFL